ncbi:hypothetical protein CAP2UW1_3943 [Candidatus Accumulibacter phosphatis]|uniref:Uncharacterized protein n=1 Tax=Accumulibacter regalis TaxID=522306 RepID=C7RMB3_ACCRE
MRGLLRLTILSLTSVLAQLLAYPLMPAWCPGGNNANWRN